jgi:hypothetical protein
MNWEMWIGGRKGGRMFVGDNPVSRPRRNDIIEALICSARCDLFSGHQNHRNYKVPTNSVDGTENETWFVKSNKLCQKTSRSCL